MLQQTRVKTVVDYWHHWMQRFPHVFALAEADLNEILKVWAGLGYYTRARNLHKAARKIVDEHAGAFPDTYSEVRALPGIGRYTAGAICSFAFNQATPILDGNVIRLLTRLYGIQENPKEKPTNEMLWGLAAELVKTADRLSSGRAPDCAHLNQALMEMGALVCTPKAPRCGECPLQHHCCAYRDGLVESLPNLGQRASMTPRTFAAFLIHRQGKWLVRQRPNNGVNAGLWEFPNVEVSDGTLSPSELLSQMLEPALPATPEKLEHVGTIRHSITRYRITLHVYHTSVPMPKHRHHHRRHSSGTWYRPSELEGLAFPSAHQKILRRFITTPPSTK